MKKILITGENSYIGNALATWLLKTSGQYQIDKISLRNDDWRDLSFCKYDLIVHTAAIVHQNEKKVDEKLYYQVNRDLTYELAQKAKNEKVNQFIFLSTMSVYGKDQGLINSETLERPTSLYGKSKLAAENLLKKLEDKNFKLAIIRPPMVYGNASKGNYFKLSKLVKKLAFFPDLDNKRSMIYIDNLSELLKLIIDHNQSGLFLPQDQDYIKTSVMAKTIKKAHGQDLKMVKFFNPLIKAFKNNKLINKVFGSLYYSQDLIYFNNAYQKVDFHQAILASEKTLAFENNIKAKRNNIWVFHHYATPPHINGFTRPYDFGLNLRKKGDELVVFSSSFLHFSNKNLINDDKLFLENKDTLIPFVFVKTLSYQKSGRDRILNMWAYYRNLFKVSKEYLKTHQKPDLIIASSPHPLAMVAGIKIAKKLEIPCICEIRDFWPEVFFTSGKLKKTSLLGKMLVAGERWIYENSDALIFLKEGDVNYIIDNKWDFGQGGKIDLKNCYYINNGVDLEKFYRQEKKWTLNDENLNNDKFKIIYTGAIRPVNNIANILDGAKLLKDYKDIEFLIYGQGSELSDLSKRIKEEKIANVKLKGYVEKKYIPYILSKASVNLLHYSQSKYNWARGNSSNKLFEYMASGKPIISTVKMGYSSLEKYQCGVSLAKDDPKNLADQVLAMYALSKKDYDHLADNAKIAAQAYDYKKLTNKLEQVIDKVLLNSQKEGVKND